MPILPALARTEECSDEEGSGHWRIYFLDTVVEGGKLTFLSLDYSLYYSITPLIYTEMTQNFFPLKNKLHLCIASEGTHGFLMSDKRLPSHLQTGQDLAQ